MGFALARVVSAVGMVYGSFPLAGDGRLSDQAVCRRIEGASWVSRCGSRGKWTGGITR